jgi:hypothetical protein
MERRVRPQIEEVEIKPLLRYVNHLVFVGNSFMKNDGGVSNYLQAPVRKRGIEIAHEGKIAVEKSLGELVTREAGDATISDIVRSAVTS